MPVFKSLNREQKEAIGLLQIGTFLEYFDLMLYVHMAVLLNELFFPKTDPHTAALLSAFAFCSTFVLRPFGALLIGHIGDTIGRKPTVIITTTMMSISCVVMANLPTYAQIGISAAWVVTGCRIAQGLSSMGELMGAEIYITEITKKPMQYTAVAFLSFASTVGSSVALGIATLVTMFELNWRIAFWIGAAIAVVGSIARVRLRETPEFLLENSKRKKRVLELKNDQTVSRKTSRLSLSKAMVSYFLVQCGWPLCFYLAYMYFNPILKQTCGYSSEQIISHNFLVSIVYLVSCGFLAFLTYKVHPLKILKMRTAGLIFLVIFLPFIISYSLGSPFKILLIQSSIMVLALTPYPADSVFISNFPVLKRFKHVSFIYALTRAIMYIITSFGLVYLTEWFGYYGLWLVLFPVIISFLWGVYECENLEKNLAGNMSVPHLQHAA